MILLPPSVQIYLASEPVDDNVEASFVPIDHLTIRWTALSIVAGDIVRLGTVSIVNAANR